MPDYEKLVNDIQQDDNVENQQQNNAVIEPQNEENVPVIASGEPEQNEERPQPQEGSGGNMPVVHKKKPSKPQFNEEEEPQNDERPQPEEGGDGNTHIVQKKKPSKPQFNGEEEPQPEEGDGGNIHIVQKKKPSKHAFNDDNDDNNDEPDRIRADAKTESAKRYSVLKKKLVTDYKKKKEHDNQSSVDLEKLDHTKSVGALKTIDSIGETIGIGSTVGAVGAALGKPVLGYGSKIAGSAVGMASKGIGSVIGKNAVSKFGDKAIAKSGEFGDKVLNGQLAADIADYTGAVGAGLGVLSNGIKTGTNLYRVKKSKNRYKRSVAKYRTAAGAFGVAQNAAGGLSFGANLGLFGERATKEGSGSQKIGGAMDIAAGTTGFTSNVLDYIANKKEKKYHQDTALQTGAVKAVSESTANNALRSSRKKIKELKSRDFSELSNLEKVELKREREKRHTAKAQLYAMRQAEIIHGQRGKESTKGFLTMLGGGAGMLGSVLTGVSKLMGNTAGMLGMLGTGLSALGGVLKFGNFLKDTVHDQKGKEQPRQNGSKVQVVDEYLKSKVGKIKEQARDMTLSKGEERALGNEGRELSDEEAKKIALLRLVAKTDLDGDSAHSPVSSETYKKAFDILTEKRANNILRSSKTEKDSMLNALGLEPSAAFEEVVSALKGE